MVGQGVLRECLQDSEIAEIVSVVRAPTGHTPHAKLREVVHSDFQDFSAVQSQLKGVDACLFSLGIASSGLTEDAYRSITYGITMAAAKTLLAENPKLAFVFVSGSGTDSSEKGPVMWARVKGQTENALLRMPFSRAVMFRPGFIQPLHGIKSKTRLYRVFYQVFGPVMPLLKRLIPGMVTTTESLAKAMIHAAKHGAPKPVLESADINRL